MERIDKINQIVDNILELHDETAVLISKLLNEVSEYVEHS